MRFRPIKFDLYCMDCGEFIRYCRCLYILKIRAAEIGKELL